MVRQGFVNIVFLPFLMIHDLGSAAQDLIDSREDVIRKAPRPSISASGTSKSGPLRLVGVLQAAAKFVFEIPSGLTTHDQIMPLLLGIAMGLRIILLSCPQESILLLGCIAAACTLLVFIIGLIYIALFRSFSSSKDDSNDSEDNLPDVEDLFVMYLGKDEDKHFLVLKEDLLDILSALKRNIMRAFSPVITPMLATRIELEDCEENPAAKKDFIDEVVVAAERVADDVMEASIAGFTQNSDI
ncbi:hypothetical protein E4T42_09275 [Aureobasidium subglaciale]|nr:hypothetical protein E4T42_09275 [Aureobasidium subglaciale]